jgi:adenine/guanine phosphoribosyltransferase-like PRPP-binding protein
VTDDQFKAEADQLCSERRLAAGDTYIVDYRDKSIGIATVWANQLAVWFVTVIRRGEPTWRSEYERACDVSRAGQTIYILRDAPGEERG